MRFLLVAALLLGPSLLTGCTDTSASDGLGDLSSSMQGGFGKNSDTYGTQRRPDVYGGSTAPSLPTSSGFAR